MPREASRACTQQRRGSRAGEWKPRCNWLFSDGYWLSSLNTGRAKEAHSVSVPSAAFIPVLLVINYRIFHTSSPKPACAPPCVLTPHWMSSFEMTLWNLSLIFIGSVVCLNFRASFHVLGAGLLSGVLKIFSFVLLPFHLVFLTNRSPIFSLFFLLRFAQNFSPLSPGLGGMLFSSNCIISAFAFTPLILFKLLFILLGGQDQGLVSPYRSRLLRHRFSKRPAVPPVHVSVAFLKKNRIFFWTLCLAPLICIVLTPLSYYFNCCSFLVSFEIPQFIVSAFVFHLGCPKSLTLPPRVGAHPAVHRVDGAPGDVPKTLSGSLLGNDFCNNVKLLFAP